MADSELSRTHPLTVAARSGPIVVQLVWGFVAVVVLATTGDPIVGALVFGAVLLSIAFAVGAVYLSWWNFRFGVLGDDLLIVSGVVVKRRRTIPLARIQGVDIKAGLLSRVLGLAELSVQTAGGAEGEAEALIGAIPLEQAKALRAQLLSSRASRVDTTAPGLAASSDPAVADSSAVPLQTPPARPVFEYRLPLVRLFIAGATSNAILIAVAAIAGLLLEATQFFSVEALSRGSITLAAASPLFLIAVIVGTLATLAAAVFAVAARDYGFVARRSGPRVETEAGLFERRMTSIPVARIQTVRIEQTPLRRLLGFASVHADTAGSGPVTSEQGSTPAPSLLPLVRTSEIRPLLHGLLPESAEFPRTRPMHRHALRFYVLLPTVLTVLVVSAFGAVGLTTVLTAAPDSRAALVGPLVFAVALIGSVVATVVHRSLMWRAAGYGVGSRALTVQSGALGMRRVRLPRTRIQSMSVRQSPFQRRAGLATLTVTSVSGSSASVHRVLHMPLSDASQLAEWYSPSMPDTVE